MTEEKKTLNEIAAENFDSAVGQLFYMLSKGAQKPRDYKPKNLPKRITLSLPPEKMEILNTIGDRLGASRAKVATLILDAAINDAAAACGFTIDEKGKIPKKELNWDTTGKGLYGFSFPEEEV